MNSTIITATLNQMAFLFILIAVGFLLAKLHLIPKNTPQALSKLENYLFIPALVTGTFINNFTVERLQTSWKIVVGSIALEAIVIPVSLLCIRLEKDKVIRKVFLYGLCFSNFGFVGNAIVSVLFPDIFLEYLIFTLVLWILIDLWGIPALLMGDGTDKLSMKQRLKKLINPMFIGMIIGMLIGISGIKMPLFVNSLVTNTGNCMSPIAMLLTGMILAETNIKQTLKIKGIYWMSILRLLVYPLAFIGFTLLVRFNDTFLICAICSLAMPLGLNTIVIPAAYDRDSSAASGMVLVSHLASCLTIPFIFWLFQLLFF